MNRDGERGEKIKIYSDNGRDKRCMYIVCSNDIIQSFEVFVNRSKDQEKGVESLKRCEKEANVSMCMGFVDFHPSV